MISKNFVKLLIFCARFLCFLILCERIHSCLVFRGTLVHVTDCSRIGLLLGKWEHLWEPEVLSSKSLRALRIEPIIQAVDLNPFRFLSPHPPFRFCVDFEMCRMLFL